MFRRLRRPVLVGLCSMAVLSGCDKEPSTEEKPSAETDASEEARKQSQVNALLKANGFDPSTLPAGDQAAPGTAAAPTGSAEASPPAPAVGSGSDKMPAVELRDRVEVVDPGAAPRKKLRYQFEKDRERHFSIEMVIAPKESVNGQPAPLVPPVQLTMSGVSKTMFAENGLAARQNTFDKFVASSDGLPPEIAQQQAAQFQALEGLQLLERVHESGQVLDMQVSDDAANHPQVLALLQNLQDAMTNSYLPLPTGEVGPGAKWKISSEVETAGIKVKRLTEVTLKSLQGDKAQVELKLDQSAPAQKLLVPGLPPGAVVELLGIKGGGTGTMTVDFKTLETDRKVETMMSVSQRITGVEPKPVLTSSDTGLKLHVRIRP